MEGFVSSKGRRPIAKLPLKRHSNVGGGGDILILRVPMSVKWIITHNSWTLLSLNKQAVYVPSTGTVLLFVRIHSSHNALYYYSTVEDTANNLGTSIISSAVVWC